MEDQRTEQDLLKRRITRWHAIKAGGVAALGLAFSKPVINTIRPSSVFAQARLLLFLTNPSASGGTSSLPALGLW